MTEMFALVYANCILSGAFLFGDAIACLSDSYEVNLTLGPVNYASLSAF